MGYVILSRDGKIKDALNGAPQTGMQLSNGEQFSFKTTIFHANTVGTGFSFHSSAVEVVVVVSHRNTSCVPEIYDIYIQTASLRLLQAWKAEVYKRLGVEEVPEIKLFPENAIARAGSFWERFKWLLTGQLPNNI